jgi:replication factor A1
LCIIAGDETGDTDFIAFGRIAQQLTKKTADTLLASNLPGFIPDAITKLLERTYIWNVSLTDNTIESGTITLQVNSIVAAIDDGSAIIPATPTGSQSSSFMLSKAASRSMQSTPGISKPLSLPATSDVSLDSSCTPTKPALLAPELLETPEKNATVDKVRYLGIQTDYYFIHVHFCNAHCCEVRNLTFCPLA